MEDNYSIKLFLDTVGIFDTLKKIEGRKTFLLNSN